MRALAHPTRLRLLEAIAHEGTLTATRASELLGESVPSCSFHLRQLAKYGFIEPAEGGAARERPYRRASAGQRWDKAPADPETAAASQLLSSVLLEHELARLMRWWEESANEPPQWLEAAQGKEGVLYLTTDELIELGARLEELTAHHPLRDRTDDPQTRPSGARPIKVLAFAYPIDTPPATTSRTPPAPAPRRHEAR